MESIKRFADAIGIPVHELFLEAPLEGRSAVWNDEGDSLVALLSSYVREMDPTRRRMLMRLAKRLAQGDQGTSSGEHPDLVSA